MKTKKYNNSFIKISHTSSTLAKDAFVSRDELKENNKLCVDFTDGCFKIKTRTQTICSINLNDERIVLKLKQNLSYVRNIPVDIYPNHNFFILGE